MQDLQNSHVSGPRRARRAMPFAAGAVAGAALLAGAVTVGSRLDPNSASGTTVAATSTVDVAQTATTLSAEEIYARDSAGVVDITVTENGTQSGVSPFGPSGGTSTAEGTGFVIDTKGDIVTAHHVVDGASSISVRFKDGSTAKATLVGTDPSTDTAVIKVDVPSSKLIPLRLGDSSAVDPGEGVVAIGSPFGYEQSITAGIVSAVDRDIEAPNGYSIPNTIQTDAAINHGNSGGPLIDETGSVIGINVQIAAGDQSGSSQNAGVGFAVPSNSVKAVVADLIAGRAVQHAYLGVSVGTSVDGVGAAIGTVKAGGPGAAAGLRSGDLVTAFNGKPITDANELTSAIAALHPGDKATLKVERNGSTVTLTVTLGTRPATTA